MISNENHLECFAQHLSNLKIIRFRHIIRVLKLQNMVTSERLDLYKKKKKKNNL